MTNAAGTENRFPRTVIEAVYGLSSYLQTQFSNLADIYMPIEGITEVKTNQEFIYRKSPQTIKSKALTIDRVKGKSVVWNQLIAIPSTDISMTENGVTFTDNRDGTYTVSTASGGATATTNINVSLKMVEGHKYLLRGCPSGGGTSKYVLNVSTTFVSNGNDYGSGIIFTAKQTRTISYPRMYVYSGAVITNPITFVPIVIDLTLMFGDGNEPSTVAEFEELYSPLYYAYNEGTLVNNAAAGLETVGFNLWDEEWEIGIYNSTTGRKTSNTASIRSKNYIKVFTGAEYYFKAPVRLIFHFYDAFFNQISAISANSSSEAITIPSGCCYMTFNTRSADNVTTYSNNICINFSDADKNGTYEPYKRNELSLNLNSIKVKNSQGVVSTITGGLKSAGTVYDEIVGNRLIQRIGTRAYTSGDESNTSYITDGTNTNYPLSSPVTYTIETPLVLSMTAGETERRLPVDAASSVLAPFACDITYGTNPSEIANNAGYATVAGRLYNARQIWGQDFDGTADVLGALSHVTTINSVISFVESGYAFKVQGTSLLNGNVRVNGTTTMYDDLYFDIGKGVHFDTSGDSGIVQQSNTILFAFEYPSHFTKGLYSDSYITAGAAASSSDRRLKDNLTAITEKNAIDVINALVPMEWRWNDNNTYLAGKRGAGLVAQDVLNVLPFAVVDEGADLALNYNVFHAYEIAVIKNHEDRINELERIIKEK